jgi:hypothetical protein
MRSSSSVIIIGPNFEYYNALAMDSFMKFAKNNNCLPDVVTWHLLDYEFLTGYYSDYNHYRSIESKYGIDERESFFRVSGIYRGGAVLWGWFLGGPPPQNHPHIHPLSR